MNLFKGKKIILEDFPTGYKKVYIVNSDLWKNQSFRNIVDNRDIILIKKNGDNYDIFDKTIEKSRFFQEETYIIIEPDINIVDYSNTINGLSISNNNYTNDFKLSCGYSVRTKRESELTNTLNSACKSLVSNRNSGFVLTPENVKKQVETKLQVFVDNFISINTNYQVKFNEYYRSLVIALREFQFLDEKDKFLNYTDISTGLNMLTNSYAAFLRDKLAEHLSNCDIELSFYKINIFDLYIDPIVKRPINEFSQLVSETREIKTDWDRAVEVLSKTNDSNVLIIKDFINILQNSKEGNREYISNLVHGNYNFSSNPSQTLIENPKVKSSIQGQKRKTRIKRITNTSSVTQPENKSHIKKIIPDYDNSRSDLNRSTKAKDTVNKAEEW